jgi:SAM-dependent methyltransferase
VNPEGPAAPPDTGQIVRTYDPKQYWNERARESAGDAIRAAGLDDPVANRCIDRVQRKVMAAALSELGRRRSLAGSTVLDLGCGSGRWIETLRREGCRPVGVDVAAHMLALAKRDHPGANLAAAGGGDLPFADGSFDLIWSIAVTHHNPPAAQERIVAETARVLKRDGAIVLFEGVGPHAAAGENYWPRPLREWMEVAERHGLACVWQRGARYVLLASAVEKISKSRAAGDARAAFLRRTIRRIDVWLDPYLLPVLPRRFQNRAAMIFTKAPARPR